ncbi:mucin-associated surface protein [Trypanosoma cruzi cruzi]|nr:mucin-associated surface protein [Trypanosoma cruzi cruzi]PWU98793.1 Mucin-associated surface protein (MASP) [Trypanosoma cruzi]
MAMMMTGRVLLVCALCVLWCGTAGAAADGSEERAVVSGAGGGSLPESKGVVKFPEGPQGLKNEAGDVKGKKTPASSEDEADDDDEEENNDDDDAGTDEEEITEGQSDQEVTVKSDPNSGEKNFIGSRRESHQSILSPGDISHSDSREPNSNLMQPEFEGTNTDENTPAVENPLTPVNGEQTLPEAVVGGNLPSPPKDGVDSHEQSGEDTTSEDEKNVPSPETAATPQSHRGEGSEGTGEDTKATTVIANTTDTTNKQSSDGSTAAAAAVQPEDGMESNPAKNDLSPPSTEDAAQLSTAPDAEGASNSEENTKSQSAGNPNVTIAIATQTNHTTKPGDSDGSTAVSHTTSPLLILLVACAAAAAVVAA